MLTTFIILFLTWGPQCSEYCDLTATNTEFHTEESQPEETTSYNTFAGIPIDCSANETLPGDWNSGGCKRGARRGLWSIRPNGTNLFNNDIEMCNGTSFPPGKLSCENRRSAWTTSNVVLTPTLETNLTNVVVFLPGTGLPPNAYSRLLNSAQSAGHYVIGLSYLSQPVAVSQSNAWCTDRMIMSPADCNAELHEQMLFGEAPQELRGASKAMWAVKTRLDVISLLISALRATAWGTKFLISNLKTNQLQINWEKVIFSGHSQGAGHAAYLSYKRRVPVVLFSGPQDCAMCCNKWLTEMAIQNVPRRALFHSNEECGPNPIEPISYCESDLMSKNLMIMGMKESTFIWHGNNSLPTFLNTVISTVSPTCDTGRTYHESVANDRCMSPNIEGLWTALFTNLR